VGGGNSAGQAAIYLAGKCHHVHLLVRAGGLADTMSSYLIHRIEEAPNITLRTNTEIASLEGAEQLERVIWKTRPGNVLETHQIGHVFLMTGAVPSTDWLKGCIALNDKGFVRTGPDLIPADLPAANGSPMRPLQSFETNWPGVFAVGDVRCGSVKRVAAAVGEGSACVQQVHQALRD
jgi:thioredoxin reductase (NADPH)